MRKIKDYQIVDHGVEHVQYFQGAGVSFTRFTDDTCYTGVGDSPAEALEDALEQLAMSGEFDVESLPAGWDEGFLEFTHDYIAPIIKKYCACETCVDVEGNSTCECDCECAEQSELHYFMTLYVK